MYSILMHSGDSKQTCKGITSAYKKKMLMHEEYRNALKRRTMSLARFHRIKSEKHRLYTVLESKLSLNCYNDKRFFKNEHESYAYGHYKIKRNLL